ncbi:MAG: penicillin-binding protein 2 [Anaerolineales bacterium]|nr:penicillin-binding protein 2 [Anaerolineales bacterium]
MDDPLADAGLGEAVQPIRLSRPRIISMMVGVSLLALGLLVQLVRVQFGPYAPVFADWAENSAGRLERLVPARGNIYDRNGNLLATNASRYIAEIEVRQLTSQSRSDIASVLSELLGLPFDDLQAQLETDWISLGQYRTRLTQRDDKGKTWPISVEKEDAEIVFALLDDPLGPDLSGLDLVPAPRRVYPAGTLAGHLLGFVNQEGKGFFGVEGYYDEWLAGRPLTIERPIIPPEARVAPDPPAGVNLVLTIDSGIQQAAEIALEEAIDDSEAESGQVIVMDPRNGEILAMAAWPALNPNDYDAWLPGGEGPGNQAEKTDKEKDQAAEGQDDAKQDDEEPVITPGVAGQFEPGSTFKVLTMAAALDAGVVTPLEQFVDTGEIEVGGHTIRNWDGRGYGPVDMIGCLRYSLNVCLAHVAARELGASLFYDYMTAFGIGQITGTDLAGEIPGKLRTPRDPQWTESDLGTNSFGQGVSLSAIQLLAAVSAIANDGFMVQPHIVRQVVGPQGVFAPKTTVLGQPISTDTARLLTEMLAISLEGETSHASLPGYRIAGKTGTAQIAREYGYDPRWTIASFIGWGPLPNPRFMILVRLDKPVSSPWGSVVAAPVFQELAERVVVLLNLPPDPAVMPIAGGG